ncbi:MAG TPA: hypothetical protein VL460_01500 [Caulobacteraceae bacterium]|jgi:hypothetical protein|nr:hypothetical protein [Caulobacteraceae bacterium]
MRRLSAALAGAVALITAGMADLALAAADPAANPPPPRSLDPDDIEQWIAAYIRKGGEVEAATTDNMVLFYAPPSIEVTDRGVQSVVHGEQFVTQLIGAGPIRSFRDVWRFDCAGRRFMLVESEIFAQSNLQGPPVRLDTSMERWSQSFQEGVGPGSLIAQVCREAGVPVGGAERLPTGAV